MVRARDVRGDPSTSLGDGKTRTMGDTMGDIINIIYNIYPCVISIIISNISIIICRCDDVIIFNSYRIIIISTYKIIQAYPMMSNQYQLYVILVLPSTDHQSVTGSFLIISAPQARATQLCGRVGFRRRSVSTQSTISGEIAAQRWRRAAW